MDDPVFSKEKLCRAKFEELPKFSSVCQYFFVEIPWCRKLFEEAMSEDAVSVNAMDEAVSGADGSYCSVTELRLIGEHFYRVNVEIRPGVKNI
jgi:hypothetical protein